MGSLTLRGVRVVLFRDPCVLSRKSTPYHSHLCTTTPYHRCTTRTVVLIDCDIGRPWYSRRETLEHTYSSSTHSTTRPPPHTDRTSDAGRRPSPKPPGPSAYTSGCRDTTCATPPPGPSPGPAPGPSPGPSPGPPPSGTGYGCDPFGGERGVCVNKYGDFPTSQVPTMYLVYIGCIRVFRGV